MERRLNKILVVLLLLSAMSINAQNPNDNKIGNNGFKDQIGMAKPLGGYKKFGLAVRKGTPDYPVEVDLSKSTSLVVNKYIFSGLRWGGKYIPYQGLTTNCVNMSSIGLWLKWDSKYWDSSVLITL